MKRFFTTIPVRTLAIICCTVFMLIGCRKFVDNNSTSPNQPLQSTPALLLTASEVGVFTNYTGQLSRISAILTQQTTGVQSQFYSIGQYAIHEGDDDNEWTSLYANTLINQQTLITLAGTGNPYYRGIAEVLKAITLGLVTDTWGDIPERQALNGLNGPANFSPSFDPQDSVYEDIQTLLDTALSDLKKPSTANISLPGTDDLIHGGNAVEWIKTAYILKARYHNHLSKVDPAGSATKSLTDITNAFNAGLSSPLDDANAAFGTANNEQNTVYAFYQRSRNFIKMSSTFIGLLQTVTDTDPRLPFFATVDANGYYTGTALHSTNIYSSDIGLYYSSPSAPLPLATYVEALFIQAEASLRQGNSTIAATAYNNAITASVKQVTGNAPSQEFITNHASETGSSITLQKIMTQKYIALFLQYECWTDWRRTGFPTLTPNPAGLVQDIPLRLPTALVEKENNKNAFVIDNLLTPVWWDGQ